MRKIPFSLLLYLAFSVASAEVHVSNVYYAGASEVHESVTADEVLYTNSVSIISGELGSSSQLSPSSNSNLASFENAVCIRSGTGDMGSSVDALAADVRCSRKIVAGSNNGVIMSYGFSVGEANTTSFNANTSLSETVSYIPQSSIKRNDPRLKDCGYHAAIAVANSGIMSKGQGVSNTKLITKLDNKISLRSRGESYEIRATLRNTSDPDRRATDPVAYSWETMTGSSSSVSSSIVDLLVYNGNYDVVVGIEGDSSINGVSAKAGPLPLTATILTWVKYSTRLNMSYQF